MNKSHILSALLGGIGTAISIYLFNMYFGNKKKNKRKKNRINDKKASSYWKDDITITCKSKNKRKKNTKKNNSDVYKKKKCRVIKLLVQIQPMQITNYTDPSSANSENGPVNTATYAENILENIQEEHQKVHTEQAELINPSNTQNVIPATTAAENTTNNTSEQSIVENTVENMVILTCANNANGTDNVSAIDNTTVHLLSDSVESIDDNHVYHPVMIMANTKNI
jgi:hypothetical protein